MGKKARALLLAIVSRVQYHTMARLRAHARSAALHVHEHFTCAAHPLLRKKSHQLVSQATLSIAMIDGFSTPPIDTQDLAYQADPAFLLDKNHLWKTPNTQDGWVHAHNAIRFEIGEMKRVIATLGSSALAEWQVKSVQTWWGHHEKHIHEHHSNEDDIFNHFLRKRVVYPEKLEADHVELVACMERNGAAMRSLRAGDSLAPLQPLWSQYEELMLPPLRGGVCRLAARSRVFHAGGDWSRRRAVYEER